MPDQPVFNDCILAFDRNQQRFLFISPAIENLLGYKPADFFKTPSLLSDIIIPGDRIRIHTLNENISEGQRVEIQYEVLTNYGETKNIHETRELLKDEHTGNSILVSSIKVSLCDDKDSQRFSRTPDNSKAEKPNSLHTELNWTKNNLQALINNTEDHIWSVDTELRYGFMNLAYRNQIAHLAGSPPKEGDPFYTNYSDDWKNIGKWRQYYTRALGGEHYSVIDESTDPDTGEPVFYTCNLTPMLNKDGEIEGACCFARNITGLVKTEKALTYQNSRLRAIASLTSHDLRRPVASMLGLIAVLDKVNFSNPDNMEIIEHLLTVGNEIDEVIRQIVDKTFLG